MKAGLCALGIAAMAAGLASTVTAQDIPDREALVREAFSHAKATLPTLAVQDIACVANQREIALEDETSLLFPCELRELVEDEADAAMLVTLLLAEVVERVADNQGVAAPGLTAYAPADSRVIRAQASRLGREDDGRRTADQTDEIARERARERREEELARQAEYSSVTTFLELSNRLSFCPADGRAFLKRATEYAVSPVQEDRIYGLWADDRRHALEPYLNDLSRCR